MKKKRALRTVVIILAVLLILAAAAWILIRHFVGRTNYLRDSDVEVNEAAYETERMTETEKRITPEDIYDISGVSRITEEEAANTYTFLVVGGEKKVLPEEGQSEPLSDGAEAGTEAAPADETRPDAEAIIIMTINHNTKEVIFYTFHTDLYVQIPDFGPGRLGNAYAVGGGPLLARTMAENYGLPVEHYATISLKDVAEVIGMPEFENLDISNDGLVVVEELVYSLGALQPTQIAGYISKVLPFVTHNLTSEEMLHMLMQIPRIVPYYGCKGKIPDEADAAAYTWQELDGYIVPDAQALSAFLKNRLYPQVQENMTEQ